MIQLSDIVEGGGAGEIAGGRQMEVRAGEGEKGAVIIVAKMEDLEMGKDLKP